jgi:hypothetical protein
MAGEFNYDGSHSLTISGKNTWTDWHMAPQSRPFVADPPIKEEYVDVPGADGSLDYTEVLTGSPRYGMRTGTWTFIIENGWMPWFEMQSKLLNFLHGKKHQIILDDDPTYYYTGRLTLQTKFDTKDYNQVQIKYNLEPYKYPVDSTAKAEWKWDELFGNTIYYGSFTVKNTKSRTIITDSAGNITINCSNSMSVVYNGVETTLKTGDNAFAVGAGKNLLKFKGKGKVTIDYNVGRSL